MNIGDEGQCCQECFTTEIKDCLICNGFYSRNFNQPLCTTCHLFLFPATCGEYGDTSVEKADSCDSGNEDPNVDIDSTYRRSTSKSQSSPTRNLTDNKLKQRIKELSASRSRGFESFPSGLVDSLPTEVLLCVFSYLNDIALCNARNVCQRWRSILDSELPNERWKHFVDRRWPLFKPPRNVVCWKSLYMKLFESVSCLYCMDDENVGFHSDKLETNSFRHTRLYNELRNFSADPLDGIQAQPLDPFYFNWQASIVGPQGSPYDGGLFFLRLKVPLSYPMKPPAVHFITKIFHPNISRHGDIGLDSINHNWSLALTIAKVLLSIQSLLTDPYSYVCMEPKVGGLYQQNRKLFEKIARSWTLKFAVREG